MPALIFFVAGGIAYILCVVSVVRVTIIVERFVVGAELVFFLRHSIGFLGMVTKLCHDESG